MSVKSMPQQTRTLPEGLTQGRMMTLRDEAKRGDVRDGGWLTTRSRKRFNTPCVETKPIRPNQPMVSVRAAVWVDHFLE